MSLLIDNDVVHKLAQLDLLNPSITILEREFGELCVLKTLKYKFCPSVDNEAKRRRAVSIYGVEIVRRIEMFLEDVCCRVDKEVSDSVFIDILTENDNAFDAGEMQLLQELVDAEDDLMFTGDKKFLKALAKEERLQSKLPIIEKRFVCFEQILCLLIKELGFDPIKNKFLLLLSSGKKCDITLKMCFEGHDEAKHDRVIDNLYTHIKYLREETGNLLLDEQQWQTVSS